MTSPRRAARAAATRPEAPAVPDVFVPRDWYAPEDDPPPPEWWFGGGGDRDEARFAWGAICARRRWEAARGT